MIANSRVLTSSRVFVLFISYGKVRLTRIHQIFFFLPALRTWNGCRLSDSNNVKGRRIVSHRLLARKNARCELRKRKEGENNLLILFFRGKVK